MKNSAMRFWLDSSWLAGANQSYIENLYENFLYDPNSVDKVWRLLFEELTIKEMENESFDSNIRESFFQLSKNHNYHSYNYINSEINSKTLKILELINSFRCLGHQNANINPLNLYKTDMIPELNPNYYQLTRDDFLQNFNIAFLSHEKKSIKLSELHCLLKKIYCNAIGAEYMHINNSQEKKWIQKQLESNDGKIFFKNEEKINILKELSAAEGLEKYLAVKFPGAKRFSLEGADSLIPMLSEIIRYTSTNYSTREIIIGMAHRGRLNVLVNILGKKPKDLYDEFLGNHKNIVGTGDVKYHSGFSSDIQTNTGLVHIALAFNPSHLEIINPVVMGSVRARLDRLVDPKETNKVLPITIHGDASIIGQGVVQETLNMSQARGYQVGGSVRIIINNQIGFTTSNQLDARSTLYCTDIGKMLLAPIFHVNADCPEAVLFVTRLAVDYRNIFKRDIFIDLVCYRRHGHNEADDPSATQPLMYQKIKQHPTVREIYANKLIKENILLQQDAIKIVNVYRHALDKGDCVVNQWRAAGIYDPNWSSYLPHNCNTENYYQKIEPKHLQSLARCINHIPKSIQMHARVAKIYNDRQDMSEGKKLFDWGAAENLAYATLIDMGIAVRLSGEDSGRGTFFHRHAVIHNQNNGETYIPLQNIHPAQGQFQIWDSVLSEEAVLAFEYGYASSEPRALIIWEAQFGDFANGAQVVIDQFICSGEQKWGRMCGLVMLLPHGYEGQGPEHSSARLERYLQLCAQDNIQVCVPSTPSQIYHMLRRQVLSTIRRPLIVMSPKSLLRHPLARSSMNELLDGVFQPVIDEIDDLDVTKIKRVILCSGKIYYELLEKRRANNLVNIAIIRIEQLYPFPYQTIKNILKPYHHVQDFIWCQEEPMNQGAWYYNKNYFYNVMPYGASLNYAGRPASASPAVGYIFIHQQQQRDLICSALNIDAIQ